MKLQKQFGAFKAMTINFLGNTKTENCESISGYGLGDLDLIPAGYAFSFLH
jgi:hypothetical protein